MNKALFFISATILTCTTILLGQQTQPKKIVFVCEHGAAKSIIAKAEFEKLAKASGLEVHVLSRGTTPDAEIAAGVRKGLLADGTDLGPAKPVKISAKDLSGATTIVTFGPDLSEWAPKGVKVLDWSTAPSPSKDYGEARDFIKKQVETLVRDLKK